MMNVHAVASDFDTDRRKRGALWRLVWQNAMGFVGVEHDSVRSAKRPDQLNQTPEPGQGRQPRTRAGVSITAPRSRISPSVQEVAFNSRLAGAPGQGQWSRWHATISRA